MTAPQHWIELRRTISVWRGGVALKPQVLEPPRPKTAHWPKALVQGGQCRACGLIADVTASTLHVRRRSAIAREIPNDRFTQKIARWMRTYLRVVAVQGTMQVAIIVAWRASSRDFRPSLDRVERYQLHPCRLETAAKNLWRCLATSLLYICRGRQALHALRVAAGAFGFLCRRISSGSLKGIIACRAFPKVPHAVLINVFRPLRHKQVLAALGAIDHWTCGTKRHVIAFLKLRWRFWDF